MTSSIFLDKLYKLLNWLKILIWLNLLWIGFTVAGLGILGWAPALVSVFGVLKKLLEKQTFYLPVFKIFLNNYKTYFIKSNLIGYLFLISFSSCWYILSKSSQLNEALFFIIALILGALMSLIVVAALFCIPVLLEEKNGYTEVIKISLDKGLRFIPYSVSVIASLIIMTSLFFFFPYLLIGLSVSLPAAMISLINAQIERKETLEQTKDY